jgi:UDP-N-acetyl-D-glucosamine dehydrogenase
VEVLGFDIDPNKPASLLAGKSYIKHIPSDSVSEAVRSGLVDATVDFSRIAETDAVILCVPTPLDHHLEPDLSYITTTLDAISPHVHAGHVISLESTTYPGTTEEEVVPRMVARGLVPGKTVFIVYSPEREDPGNPKFTAANIPKVVGGLTPACLAAGVSLYATAFETVVPVSSCAVAEMTKLLENIYRAVNIGLVNELKVVADAMGIDIWEVIRAASTKPFGFTPFFPGPGLGWTLYSNRPVLAHLEGTRVRCQHPFHRTRRSSESRHAGICRPQNDARPQRKRQGGQREQDSGPRSGIQGGCR